MPDYSIIQTLCDALGVTLPELMDGEDAADSSVRVYDDAQILDLLRRTQELERQKGILYGLVLIVLGIACGAISKTTGGTDVQDFVSGVLMGLSVAEILAGIESERLVEHGIFLLGHLGVDIPIRYARLAHRVGLRASYQAHKRSKDAIHCIVEVEMAACKERVSIGQAASALGRRILVSVEYR